MSRIVVIGSGASGVHFALTALERGHDVTLIDVGRERPDVVAPEATFDELKTTMPDPVGYFLGHDGEGVVYPSTSASYYGHPPSKHYVFDTPRGFKASSTDMSPRFSFARGGLAEAWTGGAYAFNRDDLAAFPFPYEDLQRHYAIVAQRVGIGGTRDDLERFIPFDDIYRPPLALDPHSVVLLERYQRHRERLQRRFGFYLGRSRVATLSSDDGSRRGCGELGRCLWGCPNESIYSPLHTLRTCLAHPRFRYLPGLFVRHFEYGDAGAITRIVAQRVADQARVDVDGDLFALAAGALTSSKIVLDSVYRHTGDVPVLTGLMDNLQIHVPFLTPRMLGRPAQTARYQFHHLAFGVTRANPLDYVHGQITTLKSASIHPIVQSLPMDLRASVQLFRAIRAGLAVANVNLSDTRRDASLVTVRPRGADEDSELVVRYGEDSAEPQRMRSAVRDVKRALGGLGCVVPPGMTRILPRGTSVHYAGTMPMTTTPSGYSCGPDGRSHVFPNLYITDGACLPVLPSKNHTFTLMANASRMAASLPPA
jgi:choline dehydrogenase-like flavoprotein